MLKGWSGTMSTYMSKFFLFLILFSFVAYAHPSEEKPTDKSIWIIIDYANFNLKEEDGLAKIEIEVEGRASSNVHHCGIAFVVVYKNGSTNYNGVFIEGPINISGKEKLIFMPEGNNWTKWRFYNLAYAPKEKLGINESKLENITSFEIWVRGYADEEGKLWNQTYVNLTYTVAEEIEEFYSPKENKNELLVIAILITIIAIPVIYKFLK